MSNEDILRTALSGTAPARERLDALTQAQSRFIPSNVPDMTEMVEFFRKSLDSQRESEQFRKSLVYPMASDYPSTAARERLPGMQSVFIDDLNSNFYGPYMERPGMLNFDAMRTIVNRTPILSAVILTRIRQIKRFCRVSPDGRSPGFQIRYRDRNKRITDKNKKILTDLESFVTNCGWEFDPRQRQRLKRDNFGNFMSKIVRDTLTMDSAPIETEFAMNKNKGMAGFYAVDGSTIRLCTEQGYEGEDEIFALQVIQGQIRTVYTYNDLIYVPRNPTTDVDMAGYGVSEVELLVKVVTGFLNAMSYNLKYFDSNQIPKGILHLYGNYDDEDISSFKRYWNSMVKGVNNTWSLPVMTSKNKESGVGFEKLDADINDVQFAKWMTFLTAIICAIYGIAPDEVNFESFTSAGASTLSGSDTEEKIINSKDKGLIPLFAYLQDTISDYIIGGFSSELEFSWAGLDQKSPDQLWKEENALLTVNEGRAQRGWDELDWGDAPLNPSLQAPYSTFQQQAQQEEQARMQAADPNAGMDFGAPGKRDFRNPAFNPQVNPNADPSTVQNGPDAAMQPNGPQQADQALPPSSSGGEPPAQVAHMEGNPTAGNNAAPLSFGADEDFGDPDDVSDQDMPRSAPNPEEDEKMVKSFGMPLMRINP